MDHVVDDALSIGRGVAGIAAIEIHPPHVKRIDIKIARDAIDQVFDGNRTLRSAEAAERGVRLRVGLTAKREDIDVGEVVGIVEMAHGARSDRARQVRREAGTERHLDLRAENAPARVEADVVSIMAIVTLAGDHEIIVAIDPQFHRSLQSPGGDRRDAREDRRLRFLAAEPTAHPPHFARHPMGRHGKRMRDHALHLARMLRRAIQMHAIALLRDRVRDLALKIKLLLPPDEPFAGQPSRR